MKPFNSIFGFRSREKLIRHLLGLSAFVLFCAAALTVTALIFQYIMNVCEGEKHSFVDGLYWAVTTMTSLGFGDIVFTSVEGRLFSGFIAFAGVILFGIMLPFSVIAVFFGPWLQNLMRYRPRVHLPGKVAGHIIICGWDSVAETLVSKLISDNVPYIVLTPEMSEARQLEEEGIASAYGRFSDAEVLRRVRVETARMVIANMSDQDNANLILTVASICKTPVIAVVDHPERKELLSTAGAAHAVALRSVLGNYLAVRSTTHGAAGYVIDSLDKLLFAEIASHGTPFIGKTLKESGIRHKTGTSVIGMWERGRFILPEPDIIITEKMVLLLVGTSANLDALEKIIGKGSLHDPVVILGYGTVGSAAAAFLEKRRVPHIIVDLRPAPQFTGRAKYIQGDASKKSVLEKANIMKASAVIATTNDDGTNVFLTLACRHFNPDMRIVARANRGENVNQLYAAGADFVVSHSSVGANILANMIEGRQAVFLTEGIHIFWRKAPAFLAGQTLADSQLRSHTGATLVAIQNADGEVILNLHQDTVLDSNSTLIFVGDSKSETLFTKHFPG
jgi:Trk K+ transport system NAD-binding subunit